MALPTTATTTTTRPVVWLSWIGNSYYINLPATDNWSMYGSLRTRWDKLRIVGVPHIGASFLDVDLHDWTFSSSNQMTSAAQGLRRIEWGIAADCSSPPNQLESQMSVNLVDTPFRYVPVLETARGPHAHGGVHCSRSGQQCNASCGGFCGYCGLGEPSSTSIARLAVVNQARYDAALLGLMSAAVEAVRTTTVTTSITVTTFTATTTRTGTATTTTTATVTTATASTVTSTTSTYSTVAAAVVAAEEKPWVAGTSGILVVAFMAAGMGLVLGLLARRDALSRCFKNKLEKPASQRSAVAVKRYEKFEDDACGGPPRASVVEPQVIPEPEPDGGI